MRKMISCILCVGMIVSLAGCSGGGKEVTDMDVAETEVKKNNFDLQEYKKLILESKTLIADEAVLVYNMGKYEYNFWAAMIKISGSIDFDEVIAKGFEWLEEEGNTSKETVENNYEEIQNQYKDIVIIETEGAEAEEIKNEYKALYSAFSDLYTSVVSTSGDITEFYDSFNENVRIINEKKDLLDLLLGVDSGTETVTEE